MKLPLVFFVLSAISGAWASYSGSWQAVAVAVIVGGVGVYLHRFGRRDNDAVLRAELEAVHRELDSIKGRLELYGMSKDV